MTSPRTRSRQAPRRTPSLRGMPAAPTRRASESSELQRTARLPESRLRRCRPQLRLGRRERKSARTVKYASKMPRRKMTRRGRAAVQHSLGRGVDELKERRSAEQNKAEFQCSPSNVNPSVSEFAEKAAAMASAVDGGVETGGGDPLRIVQHPPPCGARPSRPALWRLPTPHSVIVHLRVPWSWCQHQVWSSSFALRRGRHAGRELGRNRWTQRRVTFAMRDPHHSRVAGFNGHVFPALMTFNTLTLAARAVVKRNVIAQITFRRIGDVEPSWDADAREIGCQRFC